MTFLLIMLHTGTMFAVIAYFWKAWRKSFFESSSVFANALLRIVLATLATAVVFLALEVLIKRVFLHNRPGAAVEDLFDNLYLIAGALAVSGAVITYSGLRKKPDAPVTRQRIIVSLSPQENQAYVESCFRSSLGKPRSRIRCS